MVHPSGPERFKIIVTTALVLIDKDDNVLLLRRYNTGRLDGHYGLIGGHLEAHESVTQSIIREAQEEANIIIKPEWLHMAGVLHSKAMQPTSSGIVTLETVDFFFICRQWEGMIQNNEPYKHDELGFFPLAQLPRPLMPHDEIVLYNAVNGISFAEYGW